MNGCESSLFQAPPPPRLLRSSIEQCRALRRGPTSSRSGYGVLDSGGEACRNGAEGQEMTAPHSSARRWKPGEDDQLRALAASGEVTSNWTATQPQSFGRPKASYLSSLPFLLA